MRFNRKLIDKQGNIYCVEIPPDVDPENTEEVLLAAQEGIIKLLAYKLVGDVYRRPADNVELENGGKSFTFYKKVNVFEVMPSLTQEDFGQIIEKMLAGSRNQRINKVRLTTFEGKEVFQDQRGYYIKRVTPCALCEAEITGTQRLSMNGEEFTRAQMFEADDPKVKRHRPGSKKLICAKCAPIQIALPELQPQNPEAEVEHMHILQAMEPPKVEVEKPKVDKNKRAMQKILQQTDMSDERFRGYVMGVLETLLD